MSVRFDRGGWEVRWLDGSGRKRAKRFKYAQAARAFDEALGEVRPAERRADTAVHGSQGGVYPYSTAQGTRWRYVVRRSDGKQTSKRGFTSRRAAREACRRLVEQIDRGEVRHTKQTLGSWWDGWLRHRKPYLEPNAWRAYEVDGRKRLVPAFGDVRLDKLGVEQVRTWMDEQAEAVEAGEIAAKTINNTLGTLVVCLNAAVKDRVIASNPALGIERLPPAHIEHDYLRLHEIPLYLDACVEVYRPLAEVLVRAGLRISEAIALQTADLELKQTGGFIVVYRSQKKARARKVANGSTKGDKFRSVEIGPGLSRTLADQLARRAEMARGDQQNAPVFVMPVRTRKAARGRWASAGEGQPFDRNTVSGIWHKHALQDAALRDMPLHSLRHTAAAAWLAGGNSLMYVQRQLGHADIGTTERYYGHLERHVLAAGAIATEEAIARASKRARIGPCDNQPISLMSTLQEEAKRVHDLAGLSDRTIAAATGAKPSTVRGWLSGHSEPTGARAERLIELAEMIKRLALVVKPESIAVWLMRPILALDDEKPVALIARGEYRRVARLIAEIEYPGVS